MEVCTMTCLNDYEMIIRMNVERRRNDALAKKRGKKKKMKNSLDPGKSKKRITQTINV